MTSHLPPTAGSASRCLSLAASANELARPFIFQLPATRGRGAGNFRHGVPGVLTMQPFRHICCEGPRLQRRAEIPMMRPPRMQSWGAFCCAMTRGVSASPPLSLKQVEHQPNDGSTETWRLGMDRQDLSLAADSELRRLGRGRRLHRLRTAVAGPHRQHRDLARGVPAGVPARDQHGVATGRPQADARAGAQLRARHARLVTADRRRRHQHPRARPRPCRARQRHRCRDPHRPGLQGCHRHLRPRCLQRGAAPERHLRVPLFPGAQIG